MPLIVWSALVWSSARCCHRMPQQTYLMCAYVSLCRMLLPEIVKHSQHSRVMFQGFCYCPRFASVNAQTSCTVLYKDNLCYENVGMLLCIKSLHATLFVLANDLHASGRTEISANFKEAMVHPCINTYPLW